MQITAAYGAGNHKFCSPQTGVNTLFCGLFIRAADFPPPREVAFFYSRHMPHKNHSPTSLNFDIVRGKLFGL